MTNLRWLTLVIAVWALLAPAAHLLEAPNKFALDGPLWLSVQQSLYRGWGALIGGPSEIAALALSLYLWITTKCSARSRRFHAIAAGAYAGMLVAFFVFNAPVNDAVDGWTWAALPDDWQSYRQKWEIGHAISALLAMIGLWATLKGTLLAITGRSDQPA